jgi:tRNA(Ser,Leu) C12 N-acetylase TAN1
MNKVLIMFTVLTIFSGMTLCNALPVIKSEAGYKSNEISIGPQSKNKKTKVRRPMSVKSARKLQAKKEKKLKRDSEKYIMENRERSLEIQTPEVRERMKQNAKDANTRYKNKRKTSTSRTKKAGRKYK